MQTELLHWISTFLEAQAAELGAATNTQLAYGRDLKDFDSFLARRALDFVSVGRKDIEAYLIWCAGACQVHPRAAAVGDQTAVPFRV